MHLTKSRPTITAPEDVPTVFDDRCIETLATIAKLPPGADLIAWAEGIREAVRVFARDARTASNNELHDEIAELYKAATRLAYDDVASRLDGVSPQARELLIKHAQRISPKDFGKRTGPRVTAIGRDGQVLTRKSPVLPPVIVPTSDDLRNEALRDQSCETISRLCCYGITYVEGRRRPSGKQSRPAQKPLLRAPAKQKNFPKRAAERRFLMALRIAWLEASGTSAARTAHHAEACREPGPFARFVQECLRLTGAAHVDAVELINGLDRRRGLSGLTTGRKDWLTSREVAVTYLDFLSRIKP